MTRGPRANEASEGVGGVVRLATDGEAAAREAVTGADSRLVQRAAANPTGAEGQVVHRTDLDEPFFYEATRAKWLGLSLLQAAFTNQGAVAIGAALRMYQSNPSSDVQGLKLAWPATLVAVHMWQQSAAAACTFDVRAATTVMGSYAMGIGDQSLVSSGLDVDFAAGDVVNVVMSVALASGGGILLVFRRRAT